jgi:hypothetical protein
MNQCNSIEQFINSPEDLLTICSDTLDNDCKPLVIGPEWMKEMTEDMIERFIDRYIAEYRRLPSPSTIEYISGGYSPLKILRPSPPLLEWWYGMVCVLTSLLHDS